MAVIATEEAAGRLARVILSDVELYARERPQSGQDLEAQIEEGRRLFASRVTPEMLPVFDAVLASRKKGAAAPTPTPLATAPAPAATAPATIAAAPTPAPATPTVAAAPTAPVPAPPPPAPAAGPAPAPTIPPAVAVPAPAPVDASPVVESPGFDEITLPGSSTVEETIHDQPTTKTDAAEPARPPTPQPLLVAAAVSPAPPVAPPPAASPPPTVAALPVVSPPAAVAPTPAAPLAAKTAAPSGPVPTLKVRVSILKILLSVAVAAGLLAVIAHYVR